MVKYSIDTESRKKIIAVIAILSIAIVYLLSILLTKLGVHIITPTFMATFGVLYWLFDNFLWKKLPWLGITNFEGTWVGRLNRGTTPGETSGRISDIKIVITQTWTRIDVSLESTHSIGITEIAGLFAKNRRRVELCYGYHKRPKDATASGHEYGNGYARLRYEIVNGEEVLTGRYFSDEYRGGTMNARRVLS